MNNGAKKSSSLNNRTEDRVILARPLCINGIFNYSGKRKRVKYAFTVTCNQESYDIYIRDSKIPDNSYPCSETDKYYLYVLVSDWLIPTAMTEMKMRHMAVEKYIVVKLYGSEEERENVFSGIHANHNYEEVDKLIHEQLAKEKRLEEVLSRDNKYMAMLIKENLSMHVEEYLACKNGTGTVPDFIGALIVNEIDNCIQLSEIKKKKDMERREEYRKMREEKERQRVQAEAEKRTIAIALAEEALCYGGKINDAKTVFSLADKYGIVIPLRTRGWILNSFISCDIRGSNILASYRESNKTTGSKKFYDIMEQLQIAAKKAKLNGDNNG